MDEKQSENLGKVLLTVEIDRAAFNCVNAETRAATGGNCDVGDVIWEKLAGIFGENAVQDSRKWFDHA
jgi:hypothetical protein